MGLRASPIRRRLIARVSRAAADLNATLPDRRRRPDAGSFVRGPSAGTGLPERLCRAKHAPRNGFGPWRGRALTSLNRGCRSRCSQPAKGRSRVPIATRRRVPAGWCCPRTPGCTPCGSDSSRAEGWCLNRPQEPGTQPSRMAARSRGRGFRKAISIFRAVTTAGAAVVDSCGRSSSSATATSIAPRQPRGQNERSGDSRKIVARGDQVDHWSRIT